MGTEAIVDVQEQLSLLLEKVSRIETNIEEISQDLHQVRPEYLQKIEKIKKGKTHHFSAKEDFLRFLKDEI